MRKSIYTRRKL